MGGDRPPHLDGVDAHLEPVVDGEELLAHRSAERAAHRRPAPTRGPPRRRGTRQQVDAGGQVVEQLLPTSYDGRVLGPPQDHPHRHAPPARRPTQPTRPAEHRPAAGERRPTREQRPQPPQQRRSPPADRDRRRAGSRPGTSAGRGRQHQQRPPGRPGAATSHGTPPLIGRAPGRRCARATAARRTRAPARRPGSTSPAVVPVRNPTGSPPMPVPSSSTPTGSTASIRAVAWAAASSAATSRAVRRSARIASAAWPIADASPEPVSWATCQVAASVPQLTGPGSPGELAQLAGHVGAHLPGDRHRRELRPLLGRALEAGQRRLPGREVGGHRVAHGQHLVGGPVGRPRRASSADQPADAQRPRHRAASPARTGARPATTTAPSAERAHGQQRPAARGHGPPGCARGTGSGPPTGHRQRGRATARATASSGHGSTRADSASIAGPGRSDPSAAKRDAGDDLDAAVGRPASRPRSRCTRRTRSRPRPRWITTSTAEQSWLCAASRVSPAARASPSMRLGTSAAELAWIGRAPALVAGVHRGEHVDDLGAAHLADDQPVGPHPQRLPDQGAQGDLAGALDVGRPRLQGDHVPVVGPELGGVLDEHQPLLGADQGEQGVEQRGLARAGAAADQDREPAPHHRLEQPDAGLAARLRRRPARAIVNTRCRGTRRDSTVPGRESGASTAWKRVPSGSRRSTYGEASSRRRPPAAASRWASRRTDWSSGKAMPVRSSPAPRSIQTWLGAVDEHVGDPVEAEQRLERAGSHDVAVQRVVDGEHGGVPDRAALLAQRLRDQLGRQRRGVARQPFAYAVQQLGRTTASVMPRPPTDPAATSDRTHDRAARARAPRRERAGPAPRLIASSSPRWSPIEASSGIRSSRLTDSGVTPARLPRVTRWRSGVNSGSRLRHPGRRRDAGHGQRRDEHDVVAAGDRLLDHGVAVPRQVDHHDVEAAPPGGEHLAHRERLQRGGPVGRPGQHRQLAGARAAPRAASASSAGRWSAASSPTGCRRSTRARARGRCRRRWGRRRRAGSGRRRPPPAPGPPRTRWRRHHPSRR